MTNRFLAVIIPYYKITFFDQCLKSLAAQTNKNFNVYVGNDNSPDNPLVIINKYQHLLNLTYISFPQNIGRRDLVKQWERCIDLCENEEWLCILGDDDVFDKYCIENFYKSLEKLDNRNIDVFRFSSQRIDETGEPSSKFYQHPEYENSKDFLLRRLRGKARSSLSEHIFKMTKVKQVGFRAFPLAWNSDVLGILEFSSFGDIYTCNESLVYFRHSGLNISSVNYNTISKNQANFYFYEYLLRNYDSKFSLKDRELFWKKMEKAFLDDKKKIKFWKKYLLVICYNYQYRRLLPFIVKYFLSVMKK
jgi:glycosyltransferase involved in cell wall biosynthesis